MGSTFLRASSLISSGSGRDSLPTCSRSSLQTWFKEAERARLLADGSSYLVEKWLKAGGVAQCPNGECKYKWPIVEVEATA